LAAAGGAPVRPGSKVLRVSQDRLLEKGFFKAAGLGVTGFQAVDSPEDLARAAIEVGFPAFIKTVRGGYDGKGQAQVRDAQEALAAYKALHRGHPLIWERKVPFLKEMSVVAARGLDGTVVCFPAAENVHKESILDISVAPARVGPTALGSARAAAEAIGHGLDLVGTYCVELFLLEGDRIVINEIAPRPHNSGHFTLDACLCSQFEQQVRAICGLPLGSGELLKPAAMVNLLGDGHGDTLIGVEALLAEPHLAFHLYGKTKAAPKRKMGHFTVLGETADHALAKAQAVRGSIRWG
jgi:5-(carboxyamino)imidazole ribonucleotide synthase